MAFKEKSEKELLKMSKEEQIAYWEEFKNYYTQKKKDVQKKIKETEAIENSKNKKKMNHARFVLFGYLIKQNSVKELIKNFSLSYKKYDKENQKDGLKETDIEDINILLKYLKWDFEFQNILKKTN